MPDCPLDTKYNRNDSVHDFIRKYIEILEALYEDFMKLEEDAIYQYRFYCAGDCYWCEDFENIYSTFDECMQKLCEERNSEIEAYDICKRYVGTNRTIDVRYRSDDAILDIDSNYLSAEELDILRGFDFMWFDFPVPFKKGDILIGRPGHEPVKQVSEYGPFVMDNITPWKKEENKYWKEQGFGDNSDMNAWGYFQTEDGRIFHEVMWNYMDLEYYDGPFTYERRILVALSNFIKGKIELDLLLTTYRKVIIDRMADDEMLQSWYTKDGLLLAGLKDPTDEKGEESHEKYNDIL